MSDCGPYDLCNQHGTCAFGDKAKYCICNEGYDAALACSACLSGFSQFNNVCYLNKCTGNCYGHGNCILRDEAFYCYCLSNYDVESKCEKCLPNFDVSQNCLACKKGYLLSDANECVYYGLNSGEIGAICGGSIGFCVIIGIVWWGIFVCRRYRHEGKIKVK